MSVDPSIFSLNNFAFPATGGSDPLANPVPGAYAAGTAGYLLGNGVPVGSVVAGAITDNAFTVPVVTPGAATGILGMVQQLWRWFFKKSDYNQNTSLMHTYADDNTTVLTTQSATNSGGVQTRGPAS